MNNLHSKFFLLFIISVLFSGEFYASADAKVPQATKLFDIENMGEIKDVEISKSGSTIYTGDELGNIRKWDSQSGGELGSISAPAFGNQSLISISVSDDEEWIALTLEETVGYSTYIWNASEEAFWEDSLGEYSEVEFTEEGYLIASEGKVIEVFDLDQGNIITEMRFAEDIKSFSYLEKSNEVAVVHETIGFTVRDLTSGAVVEQQTPEDLGWETVGGAVYSGDEDYLILSSPGQRPKFLDVANDYSLDLDMTGASYPTTGSRIYTYGKNYVIYEPYGEEGYHMYNMYTQEPVLQINAGYQLLNFKAGEDIVAGSLGNSTYVYGMENHNPIVDIEIESWPKLEVSSDYTPNIKVIYQNGDSEYINSKDLVWDVVNGSILSEESGDFFAKEPGETKVKASLGDIESTKTVQIHADQPDLDNFEPLAAKEGVSPGKSWTVKFNEEVSYDTIKEENVFVTNELGEVQPQLYIIDRTNGGSAELKLLPVSKYTTEETYTLWVKNVHSIKGDKLSENVRMDFEIK
ncbi:hypothetical protein B0H94_1237 [Salsuginibacillus halophilus]|uniref:SbsA Ig-like domain-containing protein n=1 Tax=Salsuginibacillus halophilus TaxID=517424 RepID=A0A2P8H3M0_9BACI|nr:Ig-like domain-containing protein [Salsuginibacillus halophilus]PSL40811.1 hypothetical protein B0H94_1237 [Salsuginibacillus halophilus]